MSASPRASPFGEPSASDRESGGGDGADGDGGENAPAAPSENGAAAPSENGAPSESIGAICAESRVCPFPKGCILGDKESTDRSDRIGAISARFSVRRLPLVRVPPFCRPLSISLRGSESESEGRGGGEACARLGVENSSSRAEHAADGEAEALACADTCGAAASCLLHPIYSCTVRSVCATSVVAGELRIESPSPRAISASEHNASHANAGGEPTATIQTACAPGGGQG